MNSLYTPEVQKLMHWAKGELPADFPLTTEDKEYFIVIDVPMENFAWRTVEQRLQIAVLLEKLCTLVKETGIPCVIQKA